MLKFATTTYGFLVFTYMLTGASAIKLRIYHVLQTEWWETCYLELCSWHYRQTVCGLNFTPLIQVN